MGSMSWGEKLGRKSLIFVGKIKESNFVDLKQPNIAILGVLGGNFRG